MAPDATLNLGDEMPDIELPDPSGGVHDLRAAAAGKPALVIFACNHCPYVKHVAPKLGELAADWAGRGVVVYAVNSNDTANHPDDAPEHMGPFASAHGWGFPYLVDGTQEVARAYGAVCTPDIFLFDSAHRLAYRGQFDESRPNSGTAATGEDVAAAVEAVLSGAPVPADQRPPVGCSIKWKA